MGKTSKRKSTETVALRRSPRLAAQQTQPSPSLQALSLSQEPSKVKKAKKTKKAKKVKKEKKEKKQEEETKQVATVEKQKRKKSKKAQEKEAASSKPKKAKKNKKRSHVEAIPEATEASKTKKKRKKSASDSDADSKYRELHMIAAADEKTSLPPCMKTYDEVPFDKKIISGFTAAGFSAPSPIQAQAWPIALDGTNLIAVAKTGSGKTLAFLMPAVQLILSLPKNNASRGPVSLVLAPTRELAMQIKAEHDRFATCVGMRCCCLYGGVPVGPQKAELKTHPHTVVATPGRLNDLLRQRALTLTSIRVLVLDEADRMLDMGFLPQIKAIMAFLPAMSERQTLFFSATWPKSVQALAREFVSDEAVHISIGNQNNELEANKAISQEFFQVRDSDKDQKFWDITKALPENSRMIVFANTKRRVDYLTRNFWNEGLGTCAIHGDRTQRERDQALAKFVSGEYPFMFATDVAARGLDIKGVTHVLNFDMARDVESYIHRIGRTGRAGLSGISITFWNPDYDKECAPALVKIAQEAGCDVPAWLQQYGNAKAKKCWSTAKATQFLQEVL